MNPTLSQATIRDISHVMDLVKDCVAAMRAAGIEQWDEIYPNAESIARDIAAGTLHVFCDSGTIIACITVDQTHDPLWQAMRWSLGSEPAAAVHRLMVHPSQQGRGLAKQLMQHAEALALGQGCRSIRLDTFLQNPAAMALYPRLGYQPTGIAMMRKGEFAGFEKLLRLPDGWPQSTPITLTGRHITLTPVDPEADAAELFAGSHEADSIEAIWRYMPCGPFADAAAMSDWLRDRAAQPDMIPFTVTDNATGRRIGSTSLMRITPAHGTAELGYIWYEPAAQRTRANTEAAYLLLQHCFRNLCYRRMEWKCDALNERSRAAALRLGFTFEGIFRQHLVVKGRNRDTAWFAMLDHEWPPRAAAMEQWLYQEGGSLLPLPSLRMTANGLAQ